MCFIRKGQQFLRLSNFEIIYNLHDSHRVSIYMYHKTRNAFHLPSRFTHVGVSLQTWLARQTVSAVVMSKPSWHAYCSTVPTWHPSSVRHPLVLTRAWLTYINGHTGSVTSSSITIVACTMCYKLEWQNCNTCYYLHRLNMLLPAWSDTTSIKHRQTDTSALLSHFMLGQQKANCY